MSAPVTTPGSIRIEVTGPEVVVALEKLNETLKQVLILLTHLAYPQRYVTGQDISEDSAEHPHITINDV